MNRLLAIAVVVLLVAAGCGGNPGQKTAESKTGESKAAPQEANVRAAPAAKLKPDFTLTTAQLKKEFEADAAAADKKYPGKILEVDGPIEDPFFQDISGTRTSLSVPLTRRAKSGLR